MVTVKFASTDKRYLTARKELSAKYGPREMWNVLDHWPLYVGTSNLGRFMAIADLLRSTLDVPGHVAEFGSWRGANLMFLAKMMQIWDPHSAKEVHCFESFGGLQTFTPQDGGSANTHQATYQGSEEELRDLIALYELDDVIAIHKGLIQDTLTPLLDSDPGMSFSFVYCDTDLYEPTQLILEKLHPRLMKGGLFVFDEWNFARWPGESQAANEFLSSHADAYEVLHVKGARQPSMAIRKLR